ncbi:MAG: ABC transporter permease, partial [Fimbriiglobus sp.]|nr:ABC transporter permease [Fimbriiglobus sp.]
APMRTSDLIRTAFGGLWRQKARSALTLIGVAVGAAALAYTLSLGVGLRAFIENEFKSRREFWQLRVTPPNYGRVPIPEADIPPGEIAVSADLPADRRDRLRKRLIQDYQNTHPPAKAVLVTREQVEALQRLPDVEAVNTFQYGYGTATLGEARHSATVYCGKLTEFTPSLHEHLLHGRTIRPGAADEAVVSELMLYRFGLTTEEKLRGAVGKKLRVTLGQPEFARGNALASLLSPEGRHEQVNRGQAEVLDRIARQLPQYIDQFDLTDLEKAAVKAVLSAKPPARGAKSVNEVSTSVDFTVVGVTRLPEVKRFDPTDLLSGDPMPASEVLVDPAAADLLFAGLPQYGLGYTDVGVRVRPGGELQPVVSAIEGMGLVTFNSLRFYNSVKREVTLISAGLTLFAVLSMVVSAIGITNTLFTSVLERTREIGIWKAVGARDGHVLWMFLLEGAVVGLVGGLAGLGLACLASIPSDGWVKSLIEHQRGEELLTKTYFGWPVWLAPTVAGFSVLLTTTAAVFPARRAARVPPVEALRHE